MKSITHDTSMARSLMGYAPIIGRKRNAIATRLSFRSPAEAKTDLPALIADIRRVWPETATPVLVDSQVAPTPELLAVEPAPHIWVEVPGAMLDGPESFGFVEKLHRKGFTLVLRGRPARELPASLVPAFRLSLIHVDEDRRLKASEAEAKAAAAEAAGKRRIPYAQDGVGSIDLMERCFSVGAEAVIGWPFLDALAHADSARSNPDFITISKLLQMVDRGEDAGVMEAEVRRDPALAFRLLRYINSPAFGLRVEVQSFRHALMMLGYKNLKKWLSLLLTTASRNANLRPVMFASFRRGLFLERLAGDGDQQTGDELFLLGVFSLLDKLFSEPFDELVNRLNLPERVRDSLVEQHGPYTPYLRIAESVERGPDGKLGGLLDGALLSLERCNDALMHALTAPVSGAEAG